MKKNIFVVIYIFSESLRHPDFKNHLSKNILVFYNNVQAEMLPSLLLFDLLGARGDVAPGLPPAPVAVGIVTRNPSGDGLGQSVGRSRRSRDPATPRPRPLASNLPLCLAPYRLTSVSLSRQELLSKPVMGCCG